MSSERNANPLVMNAGKNGILFGKNCQISISSKGTMKCI